MSERDNSTLYLPGFEPPPSTNGLRGRKPPEQGAERVVPREIEIELNTRNFNGRAPRGKWDDTVWLGDNRNWLAMMPDETVDLILTDPPYNIGYKSNRRVVNAKFQHLENDDNGDDWIPQFAREAYRVLKNDRHLYCFCRHDTYPDFIAAFKAAGFKIKRTLIWVKNNHGSGDLKGDYAPQDEWIIYCHKGRRVLNGKRESNVLYFPKLSTKNLTHSTEKPVELLKKLIEKSTHRDELVLDPFAGSGSTMQAARELRRRYCMMELSESYYYTTEERRGQYNQRQLRFDNTLYERYDD
ncbi:MAG: DNA adenine methyltransferase YhdJ [Calditrichaeota bacterium]|nr:DNA adenine methyltransferase YhdJ [Calditrichota bacterium]